MEPSHNRHAQRDHGRATHCWPHACSGRNLESEHKTETALALSHTHTRSRGSREHVQSYFQPIETNVRSPTSADRFVRHQTTPWSDANRDAKSKQIASKCTLWLCRLRLRARVMLVSIDLGLHGYANVNAPHCLPTMQHRSRLGRSAC